MQQARNGAVSLHLNFIFGQNYCGLIVPLIVSIFAFLSLGLFPIPLIFIRYGKQLRARSRYAQEAHEVIMRMGEYDYGGGIELGTLYLAKKPVAGYMKQTSIEFTSSNITVSTVQPPE